ncbi:hypothetical protein B0H17DRAFT_1046137, partial [Mycena rosella]
MLGLRVRVPWGIWLPRKRKRSLFALAVVWAMIPLRLVLSLFRLASSATSWLPSILRLRPPVGIFIIGEARFFWLTQRTRMRRFVRGAWGFEEEDYPRRRLRLGR